MRRRPPCIRPAIWLSMAISIKVAPKEAGLLVSYGPAHNLFRYSNKELASVLDWRDSPPDTFMLRVRKSMSNFFFDMQLSTKEHDGEIYKWNGKAYASSLALNPWVGSVRASSRLKDEGDFSYGPAIR